jgi:hypothetical protein
VFTSNYQLVQEPHKAGVSIYRCKAGTHDVTDIIRTPVAVSSQLITLFNAAPHDDRAAREWGIRADARDAARRLFQWLRAAATSTTDIVRFAAVIHELARRTQEAFAAFCRLGNGYLRYHNRPQNQVVRKPMLV